MEDLPLQVSLSRADEQDDEQDDEQNVISISELQDLGFDKFEEIRASVCQSDVEDEEFSESDEEITQADEVECEKIVHSPEKGLEVMPCVIIDNDNEEKT